MCSLFWTSSLSRLYVFYLLCLSQFHVALTRIYEQGHALVISKKPYPDIFDIPDEILSAVAVASKKVALAVKKVTGAEGINIIQNNRKAAGQEVFHYHVHVIPRFENDGLKLFFKQGKLSENEANELLTSIKAAL